MRTKIVFKVNNVVVLQDHRDLYPNQIDELKWFVASECKCNYEEVEAEVVESTMELSEIDVDSMGLFDWKALDCVYITGLKLSLAEGSDEYLDAVNNGTLENFLVFV